MLRNPTEAPNPSPSPISSPGPTTLLDRLIPTPRRVEIDRIDLTAPASTAWERIRHGSFASTPIARTLFAIRTLPDRLRGSRSEVSLRIDDLTSAPDRPGFQVLLENALAPYEVVVGAVGKVWQSRIPFVHVHDAQEFADFDLSGYIKVAWCFRVTPWHGASHVEMEVRVDATDEESWRRFRRYFRVIGPASRFIRRSGLAGLARELGRPLGDENTRFLVGDDLLPDAADQQTHSVDVAAAPEEIWPWLIQMGCRRGGFYSIDLLDNRPERSARDIHPELQRLRVGEKIPATPSDDAGFEVLRVEEPHALVLGGLWHPDTGTQLHFTARRPPHYWHVTWSFVLEPLDGRSTRLYARARAAFSKSGRLHAAFSAPLHHLMERAQLHNLAARVEGRQPRDDWRDVLHGLKGAAVIGTSLLTPFWRDRRTHWGIDEETASRHHPGDSLIGRPAWSWTHGVEVEAPADEVWPWVAQIGADRGGFYSYQWLENLAGCGLRNAETVHPQWEVHAGDPLVLHPKARPFSVIALERGHYFVAHAPADEEARKTGKPWVEASWLFLVEPLGEHRSRLISRYRVNFSGEWKNRVAFGPDLQEPVGFAMDREMLLGVKRRVEGTRTRVRAVSKMIS